MLENRNAIATVAVKDLKVAAKFYGETLGLRVSDPSEPGTITFTAGKTSLFVYESSFAGTNKATAVTWPVGDDVDKIVKALAGRGVVFEHYDGMPDTTREGDVHVAGKIRVAWFKDPDGNIHSIVSG